MHALLIAVYFVCRIVLCITLPLLLLQWYCTDYLHCCCCYIGCNGMVV